MIKIRQKKSILFGTSVVFIAMIAILPSVLAASCVVYPSSFLTIEGTKIEGSKSSFKKNGDEDIIHWVDSGNELLVDVFFNRPSCGARRGNQVVAYIKYNGYYWLQISVYYYESGVTHYLLSDTGVEYYRAVFPIPDYKTVDFMVFKRYLCSSELWIDYLAACYYNMY